MLSKEKIIKNLLKLFDVKAAPEAETSLFKSLPDKQNELDKAFEYWIEQSKEIFGEPGKIEITHGMKESGIDLFLNLVGSGIKFGIQIKTYNDIKDPNFSLHVQSQKSQSLKHKLSKFIVAFAGDMTDPKQRDKVRIITSELSQQADNYVIPLSPEKVLTIYKVYKAGEHPMEHVFLERSKASNLLKGIASNMTDSNESVSINMKIKNLKIDGINRPHNFKLDLSFDKDSKDKLKLLDDIKNQAFTDKVIKIDKSSVDRFKIRGGNEIPDESTIQDEKIWSWIEKPGRKFLSIQTISHTNQVIQTHDQVIDIIKDGESITFRPKDMGCPLKIEFHMNIPYELQESLKAGLPINGPLPMINTTFDFKLTGFDAGAVLKTLNFISSLANAKLLRVFIPEDNITSDMGNAPNIPTLPSEILSLFQTLSNIEDKTGTKLPLPDDMEINQNTVITLLVAATYILHIVETKMIPKANSTIKIKHSKNIAIAIINDYEKNLIKDKALLRTHYSQSLLGKDIVIPNAQLDLSQYTPVTKLDKLLNSKEGIEEIELQPIDESKLINE